MLHMWAGSRRAISVSVFELPPTFVTCIRKACYICGQDRGGQELHATSISVSVFELLPTFVTCL